MVVDDNTCFKFKNDLSPLRCKGSNPGIGHLIARGKSSSTLCRKSGVFSGFSGFPGKVDSSDGLKAFWARGGA